MMTAAGVDGVEPVSKRGKGEGSVEKVTTAAGVRARTRRRGMMTAVGVDGVEPVSKLGKGEGGRVETVTTAVGVRATTRTRGMMTAAGVRSGATPWSSAVWIQPWQGSMGRYGFSRGRG